METGGRSDQRRAAEVGEVTVASFGYRHPEQSEGSLDFGFSILRLRSGQVLDFGL